MNLENIIKPKKNPSFTTYVPTRHQRTWLELPYRNKVFVPAGPFIACCSLESRFDSFTSVSPCRSSLAVCSPSCYFSNNWLA